MATPVERVEPRAGISGAQVAMVIGGLVVLLGLLWFFFLRGGGDEVDTAAPAPATTEEAPGEVPEEEGDGRGPGKGPVETFEVFAPKDPFDPVVTADTGGSGGGVTDVGIDGTPGAGTPGDEPGTGDEPGGSNAPGGGGGGDSSVGGHTVRLIEVFQDGGEARAQVQVDGTVFTVDEGEVFGDNFQLLSVSGDCATMLFGDDQFTLCEGEEILK
ncbi:MAG TPA: hypothetical protein VNC78_03585 [Actinomycetota bacterium]|nr:hypothetical protein [Actinomycetota bacterium]